MVRIMPQRDWVLILVLFCLETVELEAEQIHLLGQRGRVERAAMKLKELLGTRPAVTSSVALSKPLGFPSLGFLASLLIESRNLKLKACYQDE